jgi:transposase-like protein
VTGPRERGTPPPAVVRACFDAGMSTDDVAREWGCTSRTVRNVAYRHGIALPVRHQRRPAAAARVPKYPVLYEPGWLVSRLAKGGTLGAVAAEAGCSITAVRTAARKQAIADRRGHGEVRYPELHSRRWVRTQYVTHGRAVAEIAAELGASPTSVYRAISAFGLAPAARRLSRPRRPGYTPRGDGSGQSAVWPGCSG